MGHTSLLFRRYLGCTPLVAGHLGGESRKEGVNKRSDRRYGLGKPREQRTVSHTLAGVLRADSARVRWTFARLWRMFVQLAYYQPVRSHLLSCKKQPVWACRVLGEGLLVLPAWSFHRGEFHAGFAPFDPLRCCFRCCPAGQPSTPPGSPQRVTSVYPPLWTPDGHVGYRAGTGTAVRGWARD